MSQVQGPLRYNGQMGDTLRNAIRDRVGHGRRRCADLLMRAAYKLDPIRAKVTDAPGGGYNITMGQIPLARITPGSIHDVRDARTSQVFRR